MLGGARAQGDLAAPPPVWKAPAPAGYETFTLKPLDPKSTALVVTPHLSSGHASRRDPKHGWQFRVACFGYFRTEYQQHPELRFRVHAQQLEDLPTAQQVCRLLLRLQELAWHRLRLQVNLQGERVLDVWLCRQGNAGGEQWRNNLYIYSIQEIGEPIHWLREVAHEYSHALFPGITGYTSPEPWANGYLGERLLLSWVEPLADNGVLTPEDLCGASVADVRRFVQQRCLPLRQMWVSEGFPKQQFSRTDATGMGALVGLVLYIDGVYGSPLLRATFARLEAPRPASLWKAFTEAAHEAEQLHLTPVARATQVWLPAGAWRVESTDSGASLQRGKERWGASQRAWRLPASDWYRLSSSAPVRLSRL